MVSLAHSLPLYHDPYVFWIFKNRSTNSLVHIFLFLCSYLGLLMPIFCSHPYIFLFQKNKMFIDCMFIRYMFYTFSVHPFFNTWYKKIVHTFPIYFSFHIYYLVTPIFLVHTLVSVHIPIYFGFQNLFNQFSVHFAKLVLATFFVLTHIIFVLFTLIIFITFFHSK